MHFMLPEHTNTQLQLFIVMFIYLTYILFIY